MDFNWLPDGSIVLRPAGQPFIILTPKDLEEILASNQEGARFLLNHAAKIFVSKVPLNSATLPNLMKAPDILQRQVQVQVSTDDLIPPVLRKLESLLPTPEIPAYFFPVVV